jgi:DNA polymerase III epsilon subunit-like protein
MTRLYFDIETSSLPKAYLAEHFFQRIFDSTDQTAELLKIEEHAALDAETGEIVAIGYARDNEEPVILLGEEKEIIPAFWIVVQESVNACGQLVGFNCSNFDWPFLRQRSLLNNIRPPSFLTSGWRRSLPDYCIDLMVEWTLPKWKAFTSLSRLAHAFGIPQGAKAAGKELVKDFRTALLENRDLAIEYLRNDIVLTRRIAEKILDC